MLESMAPLVRIKGRLTAEAELHYDQTAVSDVWIVSSTFSTLIQIQIVLIHWTCNSIKLRLDEKLWKLIMIWEFLYFC